MADQLLEGLVLQSRPLGESDRLLTLLTEEQGLLRLAASGARRPRSPLAAAVPLALLRVQVGGRQGGLQRLRQLQVLRSYGALGERLDTLAAAQGMAELCLQAVASGDRAPGVLTDVLLQLARLDGVVREASERLEALAVAVQGSVHLLALSGYALPLQHCVRSGAPLEPPIGNWEWRCSLIPSEGLAIGAIAGAAVLLNPSELALLQRLVRPGLPRCRDGSLMGPEAVWLHLLTLLEGWTREHLGRAPRAFRLLRTTFGTPPLRRTPGPLPPA